MHSHSPTLSTPYQELLEAKYKILAQIAGRNSDAFTLTFFNGQRSTELLPSNAVEEIIGHAGANFEIYLLINDPQVEREILNTLKFHTDDSRQTRDIVTHHDGRKAIMIQNAAIEIFADEMEAVSLKKGRLLFDVDQQTADLISASKLTPELKGTDARIVQILDEAVTPVVRMRKNRPGMDDSLELFFDPIMGATGELYVPSSVAMHSAFNNITAYFQSVSTQCITGLLGDEEDPNITLGILVKLPHGKDGKIALATFMSDYDIVIPHRQEIAAFCNLTPQAHFRAV
jgi:hypothetical protein